jgi:hypothetical protein
MTETAQRLLAGDRYDFGIRHLALLSIVSERSKPATLRDAIRRLRRMPHKAAMNMNTSCGEVGHLADSSTNRPDFESSS